MEMQDTRQTQNKHLIQINQEKLQSPKIQRAT